MAEEENKKKGRLATAVLAGSALAFSSFAIGVPAAFADAESRQGVTAAQTDAVAGPSLVVDRAELSVDDFVGSADEVDGVVHTVEGAEPGSTVSYVVTGPAGVSDFSWTAPVNADGIAEFSVYAPGNGDLSGSIGDYQTVVTFDDAEGQEVERSVDFSVVGEAGEDPADEPTDEPTEDPTDEPTDEPTEDPTDEPTDEPTEDPTDEPTDEPTEDPTDEPTDEPTEDPTDEPTDEPTEDPTDEPTDEPTKDPTDEQLEIDLETSTVYPGESLEISGAGFTPEGTVGLSWNPTAQTTADTDGNISAEMTIPEDAEPGSETLTVVDEVSGGKATVDFTVLEPSMTIDPQEIALDDFVGDPEDDAGVDHTVQGAAPGSKITYVVTGPAGVNDFESTAVVNGSAEFVIFAPEISNPSVYLGDYNTVVTYENAAGETEELQGSFTVVDGSGSSGSNDSDDQADPVVDTGDPVDMNGSDNLAQTGASNAQLGLLAGLLLAVGGAFVVYSNRARLFPRKK